MIKGTPDVVGFTLKEALIELKESDIFDYDIRTTAPPRDKSDEYSDEYRVLRVKCSENNRIELIVCKPL